MGRENYELILSGALLAIGILAIVVLLVFGIEPPQELLIMVSAIGGAFLKELGESGQLAKSERVLAGRELEVFQAQQGAK